MPRKKPRQAKGIRRYLLKRLGLTGGLRSVNLLRQGMSLVDIRHRPTLTESFGPVDKNRGKDLFDRHMKEAGLDDGELERRAKAFVRNGRLVGSCAILAGTASLFSLFAGRGLLAFSLAIVFPVLLLLFFQNLLRAEQIRERRYIGGLEFLRHLVLGRPDQG